MSDEVMQDMSNPHGAPIVNRQSDPNISPAYSTPGDFAAQWATPLDPRELIQQAEEVSVYKWLPSLRTTLKEETWREMSLIAFTSGSAYVSFQDGTCPEEYYHQGSNTTVTLKTQGVKKTLGISDIMHSMGVAALPMGGINEMTAPYKGMEGLPGFQNVDSATVGRIADMKAQEILLGGILLMNGLDRLYVQGNSTSNSLEFNGIEKTLATGSACHAPASTTGAFSAIAFDRFLAEHPVRPTVLLGHPTALQELQAGYFQLGFQASQQITFADGNRVVPGYNFASSVNTAMGTLTMVSDLNFARTDTGNSTFKSTIYALRASHNGMPLVYSRVQIPVSYRDLAPGCTAISFSIWTKQSLIIKHSCAHSIFPALFSGRIVSTVSLIGS
jgi:hypothetical protein